MQIYSGKSLLIVLPDLNIFSDTSKKGWGATCQRITTEGRWSSVEKAWHINVLELEAVRLLQIQKTKFDSSTDRQHNISLLFIKLGRNPEQTFD